jgi:hypothetical protein
MQIVVLARIALQSVFEKWRSCSVRPTTGSERDTERDSWNSTDRRRERSLSCRRRICLRVFHGGEVFGRDGKQIGIGERKRSGE